MNGSERDFKRGMLEEYFGTAPQVIKQIQECPQCGEEMIFIHQSDFKNLFVTEAAECPECGHRKTDTLFNLN